MSVESNINTSTILEEQVPFGRSRLLKGLGLVLFSGVFAACNSGGGGHAQACGGPAPCGGCNSEGECISPGPCTKITYLCTTKEYCWFSCISGQTSKCCDFKDVNGKECFCSKLMGSC